MGCTTLPKGPEMEIDSKVKTYVIREVFHSLQGEGARAGSTNVFLRFAHCNLQCAIKTEGFNCDTDFHIGARRTIADIMGEIRSVDETPGGCGWVIVTGGEPTLQYDDEIRYALQRQGYDVAIETNGTHPLKGSVDYLAVSPKPGHPCVLPNADECRIVLKVGQVPDAAQLEMASRSERLFISPAFFAPDAERIAAWNGQHHLFVDLLMPDSIRWCIDYVKKNPRFSLSIQQHKILGLR